MTCEKDIHFFVGQDLPSLDTRSPHGVYVPGIVHRFQNGLILIHNEDVLGLDQSADRAASQDQVLLL